VTTGPGNGAPKRGPRLWQQGIVPSPSCWR